MKAFIILIALSCWSLVFGAYDEPTKNFFHFSISAGLTLTAGIGVGLLLDSLSVGKKAALLGTVGMLPGVAKEFIDYGRGFEFSVADISYDALGVCLGIIVTIGVNKLMEALNERASGFREGRVQSIFFEIGR